MAIKKLTTNSKTTYEVMVEVRDQSGRQKTKKRKNITSLVQAQKIEYQLKLELKVLEIKFFGPSGWKNVYKGVDLNTRTPLF